MIRVLVVEDEVDDALLVQLSLPRQKGYDIVHARTAAEALEAIRADGFDVALIDHRLPGCTGIELCRLLREKDFEGRIIILSSVRQDRVVEMALQAGADDFVMKGQDMGERLHHDLRQML